jgi:predicted metal-dependent hydrolase
LEYTIIRRPRRKTASISVSSDNRVTVVVPEHVTDERVREIIDSKARWIRKVIRHNLETKAAFKPKGFVTGEEFCYLGTSYKLCVQEGRSNMANMVALADGAFHVCTPSEMDPENRCEWVKAQLIGWYKKRALKDLEDRVRCYEERMNVKAALIRVKSLKSRWGSCSSRGNLSFNWQIIMAPLKIVDYVVVHELCHLVHLDHSPKFWNLLESVLPDYQESRRWLKNNGNLLWRG